MLAHIVLFSFSPEVNEQKIRDVLGSAIRDLSPIPGVKHLLAGKAVIPDTGFDYGITMYFKDQKTLEEYREHPAHVKFRDVDFLPFVSKKQSLDFLEQ